MITTARRYAGIVSVPLTLAVVLLAVPGRLWAAPDGEEPSPEKDPYAGDEEVVTVSSPVAEIAIKGEVVAVEGDGFAGGLDLDLDWEDPYFPYTEGYVPEGVVTGAGPFMTPDLRYWSEEAIAAFWECAAPRMYMAASEGPEAWRHVIEQCTEEVWATSGDPCLSPEKDPSLCLHLDYLGSWCGRRAAPPEKYLDKWVCTGELADAITSYANSPDAAPVRDIAIPGVTYSDGAEQRHFLESTQGYYIDHDPSRYYEWDAFIPPSTLEFKALRGLPLTGSSSPGSGGQTVNVSTALYSTTPPPVILSDKLAYHQASNPAEVHSCAEYAVEKFYDFVRVDDHARANASSPREIFDLVWNGNGALGPFLSATGQPLWQDRSGDPISCVDDCLHEGTPGTEPVFEQWKSSGSYLTRYKNAFHYIRGRLRILDGIDTSPYARTRLESWYTVDGDWHRQMSADLAGYLDDHLEELRIRGDEAWAEWKRFVHTRDRLSSLQAARACAPNEADSWECTTPAELAAASADVATERAVVDDLVAEGANYGCYDESQPTACDWAPSLAVDALQRGFEGRVQGAYQTCVESLGTGTFDNASLDERIIHPDLVLDGDASAFVPAASCGLGDSQLLPVPSLTSNQLVRCHDDIRADDHTRHPDDLDLYVVHRDRYWEALSNQLNPDGLMRSARHVKTIGNDIAGVALGLESAGGYTDTHLRICDKGPALDNKAALDIHLFGKPIKEPMFYNGLEEHNAVEYYSTSQSGGNSSTQRQIDHGWAQTFEDSETHVDPFTFENATDKARVERNTAIAGNLIYDGETFGTSLTGSMTFSQSVGAGYSARISLVGYVDLVLTAGIAGSIGVTLSASASYVNTPDSSAAGCNSYQFEAATEVRPFAGVDAFFTVGAASSIFEVGVKGSLTIIQLSLPVRASVAMTEETKYTETGQAYTEPSVSAEFDIGLVLTIMSGRISVYFALNVGIQLIVLELTLFSFEGPSVQTSLLGDRYDYKSPCLIEELRTITGAVSSPPDGGCPCVLDIDDRPECP